MQTVDGGRAAAGVRAFAVDLLCVAVFCTIGRRSHAEGLSIAGIAETAWPFLTGTVVGWLFSRGWQRPMSLAPAGSVVWAAPVVVGVLRRGATDQGTATSFIVVASLTTAVLLLGWRAAALLINRR